MEASGTSGMKVLVNEASISLNWTAVGEAYTLRWVGVGTVRSMATIRWTLSKPTRSTTCSSASDPEFYAETKAAFPPHGWRGCGKHARLTPRFSATARCANTRSNTTSRLREPTCARCQQRRHGRQMVDWRHTLEEKWSALRFGEVKVETRGDQHVLRFSSFS